jgi:hypothetical protein
MADDRAVLALRGLALEEAEEEIGGGVLALPHDQRD